MTGPDLWWILVNWSRLISRPSRQINAKSIFFDERDIYYRKFVNL